MLFNVIVLYYLEMIKLQLEHKCLVWCTFLDQINMRLISQLINDIQEFSKNFLNNSKELLF